ncbi:MAG TPA: spore maturation protein [Clostridiales bacterium]|nr:spore maturation protein [Clostridiales bacterium]
MDLILYISNFIMPFVVLFIISYGLYKKVNIYDEFIKGATEGFKVVLNIAPTLIGLMLAVGVLRVSGALDILSSFIMPLTNLLHFPSVLIPSVIIKLFSSSAATGLVLDIFKNYGPDSYEGRLISIIMSSTETIFYTMTVYFMSIGIKKTRYTLIGCLIATLAGVVGSVVITNIVF